MKLGIVKNVTPIIIDSSQNVFKSTLETTDEDDKLIVVNVNGYELFNKDEIVQVSEASKIIKAKRLSWENFDLNGFITGLRTLIKAEEEKLGKEKAAVLPESLKYFNERLIEARTYSIEYLTSILSKLLNHKFDSDRQITCLIEDTIDTIINADYSQEISFVYWMTLSRLYLLGKRFRICDEKLNRLRKLLLNTNVCDITSDLQAQRIILQREKLN